LSLESEKEHLIREKTGRELEVEDILRQIKQLDDEKSQLHHFKQLEVSNLRGTHEAALN